MKYKGIYTPELLLETILNNSLDSIYFKDLNSKFVCVSKSLVVNTGFKDAEDLIGKSDFDILFSNEHSRKAFEDEQRIIKTGEPVISQIEYDERENAAYWDITSKYPMYDKEGNIIGTWGTTKDYTFHMRVKQELEKPNVQLNEKIEEIERTQSVMMEQAKLASLGQLIGGIAHNLKSPIVSLAGGLVALTKLVDEYQSSIGDSEVTEADHREIAAEMKTWLEKMKPYLTYMSEIISAVKGHATTYNSSDLEYFTVGKIIKDISIFAKIKLNDNHCSLEINCPQEIMDFEIEGYESVMVQVLDNLIVNSIQAYNHQRGKIELNIEKNGHHVVFAIKDYAGGIKKEIQDKLFWEMVTTKGNNGTGIGLYYSYSTIKGKFRGDMWFDTKEGVGTIFYVSVKYKK